MDEVNTALIERYQILHQENPQSKIFATLAEAYRKLGMLQAARQVCEQGLKHHPNFASGRVALAKTLMDLQEWQPAQLELDRAIALAPENLLAHSLNGDCLLKLRQPKEALKSFKMVLFLNPRDQKAQKAVKKLESLTADEYDDDVFAMKPLTEAVAKRDEVKVETPQPSLNLSESEILERYLSLADAFIVRSDSERALQTLEEADHRLGPHKEITKRLHLLRHRQVLHEDSGEEPSFSPSTSGRSLYDQEKIEYLKTLLQRVQKRRKNL